MFLLFGLSVGLRMKSETINRCSMYLYL